MEPNLVLSLSSLIGLLGLFFMWHKDQKTTSRTISVLQNKVENLEEKIKTQDAAVVQIQKTLQQMDLKLTRIDTQLSLLLEEKKNQKAS